MCLPLADCSCLWRRLPSRRFLPTDTLRPAAREAAGNNQSRQRGYQGRSVQEVYARSCLATAIAGHLEITGGLASSLTGREAYRDAAVGARPVVDQFIESRFSQHELTTAE